MSLLFSAASSKIFWIQSSAAESLTGYISLDFDGLSGTVAELIGGGAVKADTSGFANDLVTFLAGVYDIKNLN